MSSDTAKQLKALRLAVCKGSAPKVAQHLKGLSLDAEGAGAAPSLLYEAISRAHLSIATTLLEAGAKPASDEGAAILVAALKAEGAHLVEPLIEALGTEAATQVGQSVREWTPLMHAAKVGQVAPIEALVRAKADLDAKMTRHGGTALMVAAQGTQLTAARCLLDAKANVEVADAQGWRALQWAAQIGPVDMITLLLERGATVDASADGVSTAMMVAVENGHMAAADALLSAKADPEVTDAQGWTALTIAAAAGHAKLLARLLEAGACVQARTQTSGRTALMAAAQAGHTAALSLLLAAPACDDALRGAADTNGTTALMLAAKNGHTDAMRALLDSGCDAFAVDAAGVSAIELACRRGAQEAVAALLDVSNGSSSAPAMQIARGMMLAAKQGHAPVVTLLMSAGAPVQHILIRAASVGDSSQVVVLLKAGAAADTEVASEAMLSACCAGHRGIVQLLLNARASVFKQDRSHGRNALHLASLHGHAPVVKALLSAGAAINAQDPGGRTALQMAVDASQLAVVEELLVAGASLSRRGADWQQLLSRATDEAVRTRLEAEHQRRQLEAELCASQSSNGVANGGDGGGSGGGGKSTRKQRKKLAAKAAAADASKPSADGADEEDEGDEDEGDDAGVNVAPKVNGVPTKDDDDDDDESDEEEEAPDADAADTRPDDPAAAAMRARFEAFKASKTAKATPASAPAKPASAAGSSPATSPGRVVRASSAQQRAAEAARDRETFGGRGERADDEDTLAGGRTTVTAVPPSPVVPPSGWLPPSDLIAAGGRVFAHELDMESLARQAAAFPRMGKHEGSSEPASPVADQPVGGAIGGTRQVAGVGRAGGAANAAAASGAAGASEAEAELLAKIEMLQLRVAAEQQCVVREQHITARMWIEKTQAEERAEAAVQQIGELERTVAAWESWHQSHRRQQRQRRQHAMRSTTPEAMLRALFTEWGITTVGSLRAEERQKLAAGLSAAVSALLSGRSPPPPGLQQASKNVPSGA